MRTVHPLLQDLVIKLKGFEGDGDGDDDENDEGEGEGEGEGDGSQDDKDTEGLKSALQKERDARKKLEKESKALRKFKEEQEAKNKSEGDAAKDEAAKERAKSARLAEGFKEVAVDNAIVKAATVMKFRDLDDALKLIDRSLVTVEQDEDDPRDVEIDEATVVKALEKLAKKKPHLIVGEEETRQDRSASRFNGGQKSKKEVDAAALQEKYPALRRGISQ